MGDPEALHLPLPEDQALGGLAEVGDSAGLQLGHGGPFESGRDDGGEAVDRAFDPDAEPAFEGGVVHRSSVQMRRPIDRIRNVIDCPSVSLMMCIAETREGSNSPSVQQSRRLTNGTV